MTNMLARRCTSCARRRASAPTSTTAAHLRSSLPRSPACPRRPVRVCTLENPSPAYAHEPPLLQLRPSLPMQPRPRVLSALQPSARHC